MIAAKIITHDQHKIPIKKINKNAVKIIHHLKKAGFDAYLVGGGVRDLLLGHSPKDFDIATNALPNQIKKLFKNCRLIGRRFRLAHIHFHSEIIEVATFRASHEGADSHIAHTHESGLILRDNVYGDINEDAKRRDFTINALYYDVITNTVLDFFNGFNELKRGVIRTIGDVEKRYREDPVRMLRAIRFAGKLNFKLDHKTAQWIPTLASSLQHVSPSRVFDEIFKLFYSGSAQTIFDLLRKHHLLEQLFPSITSLSEPGYIHIQKLLQKTDTRYKTNLSLSPAFFMAAFLWPLLYQHWEHLMKKGGPRMVAFVKASREIIHKQTQSSILSRRIATIMREIWLLQPRLEQRSPRKINLILKHRKFRAAYDLLSIRAETGEVSQEILDWWTKIQAQSDQQQLMIAALSPHS